MPGLLIRYKVTRGGLLFTLAILLVGISAVLSANNLLFLIVAMMLSTLLVSGFVSRLGLAGLQLDFAVPPHVSAGRTVAAKLYIRNLKRWIPSFSIRVVAWENSDAVLGSSIYLPVIPGGATLEQSVDVRFTRRGAQHHSTFAFCTGFPFGFLDKSSRVNLLREVLIYPSIDPRPGFEDLLGGLAGEIESHYQGLGRDFYRIRPYQPFESARHVDWKATAHTRDLQVREFAREREYTVEIFFDCDVPADAGDLFESQVACCAFLCWRLARQGGGVRLRSQSCDIRVPEEADIYTILKFLALVAPQEGEPPAGPADDANFQLVLTSSPQRFANLDWSPDRVLGPDVFAGGGGAAA